MGEEECGSLSGVTEDRSATVKRRSARLVAGGAKAEGGGEDKWFCFG